MDLPFVEKPVPPILIYCDDQSMLAQVMNTKDNSKSNKHIKHRLKSVRKMKNSGVIAVSYVRSESNLADPFTKGLPRNAISVASKNMGTFCIILYCLVTPINLFFLLSQSRDLRS